MKSLKFREFINGKFHYWGFVEEGIFKGPVTPSLTRGKHDQFTGEILQGKEVYEKDIIDCFGDGSKYDTVIFANGCFVMEDALMFPELSYGFHSEAFIAGNIYENPELIQTP